MDLKPVDLSLLVWEQQHIPEITFRKFITCLFKSLRKRWALRSVPLPLSPGLPSRADRECLSCLNLVEPNTHGDCEICGYRHLVYIGHTQVLPTMEQPRIRYWGRPNRHDGYAQMAPAV